jgi:hypothetical protein
MSGSNRALAYEIAAGAMALKARGSRMTPAMHNPASPRARDCAIIGNGGGRKLNHIKAFDPTLGVAEACTLGESGSRENTGNVASARGCGRFGAGRSICGAGDASLEICKRANDASIVGVIRDGQAPR